MLNIVTPVAFGLTTLGIIHTLISLAAVASGVISFFKHGKISWETSVGKFYVVATIVTCLTGFGIFQHDGFGKPHILGIITLLVIGLAAAANKQYDRFGKLRPFVETIAYSMTFFFHIIPGITETATRLPLDAPLASSPDDPGIQMAVGISFILFLIGAFFQVRKIKSN